MKIDIAVDVGAEWLDAIRIQVFISNDEEGGLLAHTMFDVPTAQALEIAKQIRAAVKIVRAKAKDQSAVLEDTDPNMLGDVEYSVALYDKTLSDDKTTGVGSDAR